MTSTPWHQAGPARPAALLLVALAIASANQAEAAAAADPANALRATTAAAPAADRCPLTAEQVSAAVGAKVKGPDSSCSFFPADEKKAFPSVTFVKQVTFMCSGTMPTEAGYTEKVEGLGTQAYIADRADGSWILVCRDKSPFEIRVDAPPSKAAARAAATALAKQVLAKG